MPPRILIIHFTPPDVVGGVEHIIHQHVRLLRQRGYIVRLVAGRNARHGADVYVIPQIDAARSQSVEIEDRLAQGVVDKSFFQTRDAIADELEPLIADSDVVIVHNAMTLHFSLPLTAALWKLVEQTSLRKLIAWCHDLSWTNPLYLPAMHDGYPWDLLRSPAPETHYVAISEVRREQLATLWGDNVQAITVIPNGIDGEDFLNLSTNVREIAARCSLFDRDMILLLPVRITRRKNIELAVHAVRALVDRGLDVRFLVSGPSAPHHPTRSRGYLDELLDLRQALGVQSQVIFLAHDLECELSDRDVADLYRISDVLLFPSAHEGFGLPILEAGLARVPAVVSDIPIFAEVGGADAIRFDLNAAADTIAQSICRAVDIGPAHLYRRVLGEFRWDVIMEKKIMPLLTATSSAETAS